MDDICRLCLAVSNEMAGTISEDSEILNQLSCLNIQITICDYMPSRVCRTCHNILKDIQNFHDNITQIEYKLIELLNNANDLNSFSDSLRNEVAQIQITRECLEEPLFCESIDDFRNQKTDENPKMDDFVLIHFIELDTKIRVEDTVAELKEVQIGYSSEKPMDVDPNDINLGTVAFDDANIYEGDNEIFATEDLIDIEMANKEMENHNMIPDLVNNVTDQITPENIEKIENTNSIDDEEWLDAQKIEQKCLTCFETFETHAELLKHYKSVHYTRYIAVCTDSDYTMQITDGKTDFKCNHCKKLYESVEDVVSHLNDHKSDRSFLCKICGRTFKQVYEVLRHGRTHSFDNKMYCHHGCGFHTAYKGALRDHEKRHTKEFKYKCSTCGAGFYVKTWYEQHQNIHNNVKPFVCDICGVAFHMQRYLTSHRSGQHPRAGGAVRRYVCPHCALPCYSKHGLSLHLEEHDIKKKFLCDICGKECSSKEHLKNHRNSHLGVKPFSCSICNKKFAKKFNLTLHEKAHSGEKHLCQSCGKYFAQKSSLMRHTKARHPEGVENAEKE